MSKYLLQEDVESRIIYALCLRELIALKKTDRMERSYNSVRPLPLKAT